MREANLQKKVIRYLRDQGDYVFKVVGSPMQQRGTADLLVCHRGLFVALELKAPGGVESGPQKRECRLVREALGIAELVKDLSEVDSILRMAEIAHK